MTKDVDKIELLMKNLGISKEEAEQVIADDKAIDQGQRMPFDLTPEQEKATRKYRQADRDVDNIKPVERKRKENPSKQALVNAIAETLGSLCDSVEVTNKERELLAEWDGVKYKIVLSCPRK